MKITWKLFCHWLWRLKHPAVEIPETPPWPVKTVDDALAEGYVYQLGWKPLRVGDSLALRKPIRFCVDADWFRDTVVDRCIVTIQNGQELEMLIASSFTSS